MASTKESKTLLGLSELDLEITQLGNKKSEVEERLGEITGQLETQKERLALCKEAHEEALSRHSEQESLLKEEEQKIVDRRKQLTEVGGAKSAKLVEREIDIASRTLQMMQENVVKAIEHVDQLQTELEDLQDNVSSLEEALASEGPGCEEELKAIDKEINSITKKRDKQLDNLEDRVRNLYQRVQTRYNADPVAVAAKNSCRSCFRALPHQTYNQVLAGNSLVQCPGCSRILVYTGE